MADSAGTLNCLMCGAPARTDSSQCEHCGARLATVACPHCFGMIFQGAKFCCHCGGVADRSEDSATGMPCPKCESLLTSLRLGKITVAECTNCNGLWLDKNSFSEVCADREQQSAVLGTAVRIPAQKGETKIRYVKCPLCQQLMHRHNFSNCSGIIIDVCQAHGTWFDAHELQRIIDFIRRGGLDLARQREKEELERARRRLEDARRQSETAIHSEPVHLYRPNAAAIVFGLGQAVWSLIKKR